MEITNKIIPINCNVKCEFIFVNLWSSTCIFAAKAPTKNSQILVGNKQKFNDGSLIDKYKANIKLKIEIVKIQK